MESGSFEGVVYHSAPLLAVLLDRPIDQIAHMPSQVFFLCFDKKKKLNTQQDGCASVATLPFDLDGRLADDSPLELTTDLFRAEQFEDLTNREEIIIIIKVINK